MMKAWHFSENAYPYLPPADEYPSIRVSLPNRHYDPEKGASLYDRFLDEWLIAEDEGMEIMLNEHHQTATCVDPAAPLVLAALARLSKKARLLILGADLYDRFLDEWLIAEDEGMDIMLNEHHQTATCVDPAAPFVLAALVRLSTRAPVLMPG